MNAWPLLLALPLLQSSGRVGPEEVEFPTPDKGVVSAHVYGDGTRGVILAHGGRFTRESWSEQAPMLAEAGFRVVAIDFRGRGRSGGGSAGDEGVHLDVLAAARYLRGSGARTVSVVGASFGGWAAARAAVEAPTLFERLVIIAAPVDEPARLEGRKLIIVSRDDTRGGGIRRLPEIEDAFELMPEPRKMVVLPGSAHAQFIFETDQAQRLLDEIIGFLSAP